MLYFVFLGGAVGYAASSSHIITAACCLRDADLCLRMQCWHGWLQCLHGLGTAAVLVTALTFPAAMLTCLGVVIGSGNEEMVDLKDSSPLKQDNPASSEFSFVNFLGYVSCTFEIFTG